MLLLELLRPIAAMSFMLLELLLVLRKRSPSKKLAIVLAPPPAQLTPSGRILPPPRGVRWTVMNIVEFVEKTLPCSLLLEADSS